LKKTLHKNRAGGVGQGEGHEFMSSSLSTAERKEGRKEKKRKKTNTVEHRWLIPVIPATWEAEIKRSESMPPLSKSSLQESISTEKN
jgi:hypothetical protein